MGSHRASACDMPPQAARGFPATLQHRHCDQCAPSLASYPDNKTSGRMLGLSSLLARSHSYTWKHECFHALWRMHCVT